MMTHSAHRLALGFDPSDLLKFNPAYQLGQKAGGALAPQQQAPPDGTQTQMTPPGGTLPAPPDAPMSDTTRYLLIGGGVIAAGIIIYAVATAKRR